MPNKPQRRKPFARRHPTASRPHSGPRLKKDEAQAAPTERPFSLELHPKAAQALKRIGSPPEGPFVPDPFQLQAVELSAQADVIVSAPTGSGKTWIAQQAIARQLQARGRCWYASPLKALSNAKFLEFGRHFGPELVGLLTGDHKVNLEAPIIIGTTEILRNQLYDAMSRGRDLAADLVILDEAHYLGDRERGVVWEEVLIYLPPSSRLLLLSATVANGQVLAHWLKRRRGTQVEVISGGERPVPLEGLCLWPSGRLEPLALAAAKRDKKRAKGRAIFHIQMPNSKIMGALRELNMLPAIFFLKSRADCDLALNQAGQIPEESDERLARRLEIIDEYLARYPFLTHHPHLGRVRRLAVASHHAGHLPHYKLLVEELMSQGLLDAIFATSTVSAGVNFPARTVVIRQSDRFNGQDFLELSANEFTQMTGRAGRRGRDLIGFALMIPGPHMDLGLMAALMHAPPDPVESVLEINFSMVLNLLNSFQPQELRDLMAESLAAWQKAGAGGTEPSAERLRAAADELYASFVRHLNFLKAEGLVNSRNCLTADGLWAGELRLEHPLVFYTGLKSGAWPLSPPLLAAAVAGLSADKSSNKPPLARKPPKKLTGPLIELISALSPLLERLQKAGFETPLFNLRPAWAIWYWAQDGDFDEAVELLGLGAGDMAMLCLRCADHLRQLAGLKAWPELNQAARQAIGQILREPVSSPL